MWIWGISIDWRLILISFLGISIFKLYSKWSRRRSIEIRRNLVQNMQCNTIRFGWLEDSKLLWVIRPISKSLNYRDTSISCSIPIVIRMQNIWKQLNSMLLREDWLISSSISHRIGYAPILYLPYPLIPLSTNQQ